MKRLLLSVVIFSFLFAACENPLMKEILEFKTVKYNSNGGSHVPSQNLIKDRKLDKPDDPVKTDFLFVAWFIDNDTFVYEWDFDVAPKRDMTLHAKWKPVKQLAAIEIKSQPEKLTYTHGDALDLNGLVVTMVYDDGTEEDAAFGEFASKGITAAPAHGTALSRSTHNGQPVAVSCGGFSAWTENLTVDPKAIVFNVDPIPDQEYTGSAVEPAVTVRDGEMVLTLTDDYIVASYTNNTNPGTANVTITGAGNYEGSTGAADFIINKAAPIVDQWPVSTPIIYGEALSTSTLNGGLGDGTFDWTDGTIIPTVINSGYSVTFTPTDTAQYRTLTRNVDITVAKAAGANITSPLNAASVGMNSVTLNAITVVPANGQTVEYAVSSSMTAPTDDRDWQADTTFSGLSAATSYFFFARSAANDNYKAGTGYSSNLITTLQGITITINVSDLIDQAPNFDIYDNSPLILTGTQTATVNVTGYQTIYWEIRGVGAHAAEIVSGDSSPITLSAANTFYNSPGFHTVTVRVTLASGGTQYQNSFRFKIE